MNKPLSYGEFARIAAALLAQEWIFAKTMPENPHHYALRKNFRDNALFDSVVAAMRDNSYGGKWAAAATSIST